MAGAPRMLAATTPAAPAMSWRRSGLSGPSRRDSTRGLITGESPGWIHIGLPGKEHDPGQPGDAALQGPEWCKGASSRPTMVNRPAGRTDLVHAAVVGA